MATKKTIIETKQLGYDIKKAQNSTRFGLDIDNYAARLVEGYNPSTYDPTYSSVNGYSVKPTYDEQVDDKYPLDEDGAIQVTKSEKYGYEIAEFDYNAANPTHVYLLKASKVSEMRKNVPYIYQDYLDNTQEMGTCSLTVEPTVVGGETRTLAVTVAVNGKPTLETYTEE